MRFISTEHYIELIRTLAELDVRRRAPDVSLAKFWAAVPQADREAPRDLGIFAQFAWKIERAIALAREDQVLPAVPDASLERAWALTVLTREGGEQARSSAQ